MYGIGNSHLHHAEPIARLLCLIQSNEPELSLKKYIEQTQMHYMILMEKRKREIMSRESRPVHFTVGQIEELLISQFSKDSAFCPLAV